MIVISEQFRQRQTPGMSIVDQMLKTKPKVTSDYESSCSSTVTDQQEHVASKEQLDSHLLRQTTASIADALLRLGGSEDSSDSPSCDASNKSRKRAVSLAADTDASSETDTPSNPSKKRKIPNEVLRPVPTKLRIPVSTKPTLFDMKARTEAEASDDDEQDQVTSFSTNEFQIHLKDSKGTKAPGDIGCISQLFHQDFRPLMAAPRLPNTIVPEYPPPMNSKLSPFAPPTSPPPMYSTAITEHNDCLIMHSYTVLPRTSSLPNHMTRTTSFPHQMTHQMTRTTSLPHQLRLAQLTGL